MTREKSLQEVSVEANIDVCPDCGNKEIGKRGNEVYCKKCGLVIE